MVYLPIMRRNVYGIFTHHEEECCEEGEDPGRGYSTLSKLVL